eukprot:m.196856 g.196856  ORF g.196856 m.196856 type:complete len:399 (+) comp17655_c0_seq11:1491-2687(+)
MEAVVTVVAASVVVVVVAASVPEAQSSSSSSNSDGDSSSGNSSSDNNTAASGAGASAEDDSLSHDAARDLLGRSVALLLMHAGFEDVEGQAMVRITQAAEHFLQTMIRATRIKSDFDSDLPLTSNALDIVRRCCRGNLQGLRSYYTDDVRMFYHQVTHINQRILRQRDGPQAAETVGRDAEEDLVMGRFGADLGLDYLALREFVGLDIAEVPEILLAGDVGGGGGSSSNSSDTRSGTSAHASAGTSAGTAAGATTSAGATSGPAPSAVAAGKTSSSASASGASSATTATPASSTTAAPATATTPAVATTATPSTLPSTAAATTSSSAPSIAAASTSVPSSHATAAAVTITTSTHAPARPKLHYADPPAWPPVTSEGQIGLIRSFVEEQMRMPTWTQPQ